MRRKAKEMHAYSVFPNTELSKKLQTELRFLPFQFAAVCSQFAAGYLWQLAAVCSQSVKAAVSLQFAAALKSCKLLTAHSKFLLVV